LGFFYFHGGNIMNMKKIAVFAFVISAVGAQLFAMEPKEPRHRSMSSNGVSSSRGSTQPYIVPEFRGIAASPEDLQDRLGKFLLRVGAYKGRRMTRANISASIELQNSFLEFLKSVQVMVKSADKKEQILAMIGAMETEIRAGNFDAERLNYFAQAALDVVAEPGDYDHDGPGRLEPIDPVVAHLMTQYAAMALKITEYSQMIDASGKGEDFVFEERVQEDIKTIGAEIVRIAHLVAGRARGLSDDEKDALRDGAQAVQENLNKMSGATTRNTPQVAAKVAVWTVQALILTSNALAGHVQRLALTDRPDLVAQRSWYRRAGLCSIITAVALTAALVAGNAAGIIDIQTVPVLSDLLAGLPGLL
jgi:hypothetical protein